MAMRFGILSVTVAMLMGGAQPVHAEDASKPAAPPATVTIDGAELPIVGPTPTDNDSGTVGQEIAASKLKTFANALLTAGIAEELNGQMPITVYAPSDDAFKAMPPGKLDDLMKPENKRKLISFLQAHMVQGIYDNATMRRMDAAGGSADVPTKAETNLHFRTTGNNDLTVTDIIGTEALVSPAEIKSKNGVIEIIDKVLVAPDDLPNQ